MSREILQRLAKELGAVAESDDFVARSAKFGAVKSISLLDEFARDIAEAPRMWHTPVKEQGIKIAP